MKTFGQILREKRKEMEWTQKDLADRLNTYPSTISAWENDRGVPSIYTAFDIADVLGCSIDELAGRGSTE